MWKILLNICFSKPKECFYYNVEKENGNHKKGHNTDLWCWSFFEDMSRSDMHDKMKENINKFLFLLKDH